MDHASTQLDHAAVKRNDKADKHADPADNVLSSDGLRYKVKKTGSPFGAAQLMHASATMSCFKCGKHQPPASMESKRILGKVRRVCPGSCKS